MLERGVLERVFNVKRAGVFTAPFRPRSRQHFFSSLQGFTTRIRKHLPSTVPITQRAFVDTYRGRKRVLYEQALASLAGKPLEAKDADVKVFVKYEKFNFSNKPDAVPRVISPRSPRFNVEFGRFIRPIEERIFEAIGELYDSKTVMKGMNALDSGRLIYSKWARFKNPVAVGLDAERFDQHVSKEALEYEHMIYSMCFWRAKDRVRLARLASQQLNNRCSGNTPNGWLKYTTQGGRMSGDMNTSLGNCLLMCAMIYSYSVSRGVTIELANNGDDCVVFMETSDLQRFMSDLPRWFKRMGFSMVVEKPVYEVEQVAFCQTQPVWVGPSYDDYLMVRDPRVALAKDVISLKPLTTKSEVAGWLDAVGCGGLALAGGIPVWQEFYQMYVRSASVSRKKARVDTGWGWGVRMLGKEMKRVYGDVNELTRVSFYLAFDISADDQKAIERVYREKLISLVGDHQPVEYECLPL